jgi:F-type H+-transporting ATPase subunit c
MRKLVLVVMNTLLFVSTATLAFAADDLSSGFGMSVIGLAIGIGLAAAGCGLGQGIAVKSACEGIARNPDASGKISPSLMLGLAFVESLCIYALLIDLIILFTQMS